MEQKDARSLSLGAQEDLRQRVVMAVADQGMYQAEAARVFAVSRQAINGWLKRYRSGGVQRLKARRQRRPPEPRLSARQAKRARQLIVDRCPDQLKLPFALWTREAVRQLLIDQFGVKVSVWTVGRYLKAWGMTPQKPLRRAHEQDPEAVDNWLTQTYPTIRRQAKAQKARIHWIDEMGMRSTHQTGRSSGIKGQPPVIPGTGKRFGCNMISAITNRGRLYFMVFKQRFSADVFIRFLLRLLRQVKGKVFLIADGHPVHRSQKVKKWLTDHEARIQIFFLPDYSPELNPDDLLNQDVKSNPLGRRRPKYQEEMVNDVRSYVRNRQRRPKLVQRYFHQDSVQYAAD